MPVAAPVLLGLPIVGALLTKVFELFLDLFLRRYTLRIAIGFSHIALMIAIYLVFAAAVAAVIQGIYWSVPPLVSKVIAHFFPASLPLILSGFATIHMAEFVLDIKNKISNRKYSYLSAK